MFTMHEELIVEGVGFYEQLFRERETLEGDRWFARIISEDMNKRLYRMPLEEEVIKIVSELASNKSLGPKGFPRGFYKKLWPS